MDTKKRESLKIYFIAYLVGSQSHIYTKGSMINGSMFAFKKVIKLIIIARFHTETFYLQLI